MTNSWQNLAHLRQRIIDKQARQITKRDRTIVELTTSLVQLENDYDHIEAELKALTTTGTP